MKGSVMNSRLIFGVRIALVVSAASGLAAAQQPSPLPGVPVHMIVTVETRHGAQMPVIDKADVMVFQGRDRDTVTDWVPAQGDRAGLDLFILLDDASSANLGTQLEDLRQFINTQPGTTRIGVAYMQNGIAQIAQNLTSDHALASKALRLPLGIPGANGSPYFSLGDLIKRWPQGSPRREVLMATDGVDRFYGNGPEDPYVAEVIEQAQRAGVIVFAIYTPGVGHFGHSYWSFYWGQYYLSQTVEETGGEGYYLGFYGPPVSFVPYLNDLAQRLTRQYLLTFLAQPEKKAGMRRVRLATEVSNAELVAADSVYVPAGQ